ncbi:N-acyl homoserine lactonase family protein [Microbacterium sp. bgisy207]|uniref:N-acyl homoserine lactonase family protein n=1 Tax=Microbacterium sp. bgisy207 TaxID=3413800 RepID=UPI003EBA624A
MTSGGVGRVTVLSIGEVRLRPHNIAGSGTPMLWWTFTSRRWTEPLPVNVVLIEHDQGWVLWDTGQAPESADAPRTYFPRGFVGAVYARQVDSTLTPGQGLGEQLELAGVPLERLALAAVSHLHYDHAGNVGELAAAGIPVLVSEAEHALLTGRSPHMHGVLAEHLLAAGVRWRPVSFAPSDDPALTDFDGAYDIFGDGALTLLPTPGHTTGSMSLLVRRGGGRDPLLLVGDATYDPSLIDRGVVPDVGDRKRQRETLRRVVALRDRLPGLRVIAGHDPRAAESAA